MDFPRVFYVGQGGGGSGVLPPTPTPTTDEESATTVEALRKLYVKLGGNADNVENCVTSVEVLNAIAALYNGESDAVTNAKAVDNIADVASSGGGGIALRSLTVKNNTAALIVVRGISDAGDGHIGSAIKNVESGASALVTLTTQASGLITGWLEMVFQSSSIASTAAFTAENASITYYRTGSDMTVKVQQLKDADTVITIADGEA